MTDVVTGGGALSRLLEDLARIPRSAIPESRFDVLEPGSRVGRFEIRGLIGRGGFGVVYEAFDPELSRPVAIKVLRPGIGVNGEDLEWLLDEAEAVARLNHPAIVTIHEVGQSEIGPFLVFERLRGEGLDARLARGPLPPDEAAQVALAVAGALAHAHAAGVLHRDLKPANVFLCDGGGVKVLDFGIAQLFDRPATPASGTPGYMAPEQRDGRDEDARTDLHALGAVIQEMLPPGPRSWGLGQAASLDRRLRDLAREMTDPDRGRRPASASVVLERLERLPAAGARRRSGGWFTAVAGLAAILAVAAWPRHREMVRAARVDVAVAPTHNESGARELDRLSGYLVAGLRQSPYLRVVSDDTSLASLRPAPEASSPSSASGDPSRWRTAAARRGASLVLVPSARSSDDGLKVEIASVDVGTGDVRARVEAGAPTVESLPAALDRALAEIRRLAGETDAEIAAQPRALSQVVTPSLQAFALYSLALECSSGGVEARGAGPTERCASHLRKALEADPGFAQAHYLLARILGVSDRGSAEARRHLEAALLGEARTGPREKALALAWKDYLDGDESAAARRNGELAARDPGDVEAHLLAGDIHFHASRFGEAAPYLVRALSLGAPYAWAYEHAVEAYALAGMTTELGALVDRLDPASSVELRAAVRGNGWLGRHEVAVRLAREAVPSAGESLLMEALSAAGEFDEAARVADRLFAADPANVALHFTRVKLAMTTGRYGKAWRLAEDPREGPSSLGPLDAALLKATVAAGALQLPRLRAEADKLLLGAPEYAPLAAVQVALFGTLDDARRMRSAVPPGSLGGEEIAAIEAWKSGDPVRAVSMLTALEQRAPWPNDAIAPSYLIAEVARASDPVEALAAAERFRAQMPRGLWRGWAIGRSFAISADAAQALGREAEARAHLLRLKRLTAGADPTSPIARERDALQRRLAGA